MQFERQPGYVRDGTPPRNHKNVITVDICQDICEQDENCVDASYHIGLKKCYIFHSSATVSASTSFITIHKTSMGDPGKGWNWYFYIFINVLIT